MYHLLYRSISKGYLSEAQIEKILQVSRKNNQHHGITGLLIYRDKTFLQVLEGNKELVLETFDKISLDPRHTNVEVLFQIESEGALFKDWSMGHIKEDHISSNSLNHLSSFIETAAAYGKVDKGLIRAIFKKFIISDSQYLF